MVCPNCNKQMMHLNEGDGHHATDSYQTYDYMICTKCNKIAIEFYHTEFVESIFDKPEFKLINKEPNEKKESS